MELSHDVFICIDDYSNKSRPHWCCLVEWTATKPSMLQIHNRKRMIWCCCHLA